MATLDLVPRATWRMPGPLGPAQVQMPCRGLWLHHAAGSFRDDRNLTVHDDVYADARSVARTGIDRFGRASYSWFTSPASPRGQVLEMQGHHIGAHTGGHNSTTEALCVMGNFQLIEPDDDLLWTIAALAAHGATEGWWPEPQLLGGHTDAPGASTACPGSHLHDAIPDINRLAHQIHQENDMAFTDDDRRLLHEVRGLAARAADRATLAADKAVKGTAALGRMERIHGSGLANLEPGGDVDVDALAAALSDELGADVATELGRRLTDG